MEILEKFEWMGISEFVVWVCLDLLWTMDTYGTSLRIWTIFLLFFLIFLDFSSHLFTMEPFYFDFLLIFSLYFSGF